MLLQQSARCVPIDGHIVMRRLRHLAGLQKVHTDLAY